MSQRGGQHAAPRYMSRHSRLQQTAAEPRIPPPPLLPELLADFVNDLPPPNLWVSSLLSYLIFDPLLSLTRLIIEIVVSPRTHRFVLRIGVLSAIFWTALGLAIAAYVGFYRAWVPDIGIHNEVWLQYGYDSPPFADIDLRSADGQRGVFAEDQKYDVSLDLVVPLSAANIDLGNFMVTLDLISPSDSTIHRASKPTMLIHESAPVRAMNNLAFQLTRNTPHLFLPTASPPIQLITIPLLRRAILQPPTSGHPFANAGGEGVVRAHISVGRQDALKYWMYGGGHGVGGVMKESGGILKAAAGGDGFRSRGELQTHGASLRFDAHLTGLRYFMYHHPLASFLIFTTLFLFFELVSALTLWALAALYTSNLTQPSLAVEDNYLGDSMRSSSSEADLTPRGTRQAGRTTAAYEDEEGDSATITGPESEGEGTAMQRDSLASLQARDAQEQYEARRAEMLRNEAEGRRMTAVDAPAHASGSLDDLSLPPQGRRVLGRLDEETEEDTDVAPSEASIGWEDVGDDPTEQQAEEERASERSGLRRRRGDAGDRESTAGASTTSRAPSTARSIGLSSFGGTTAGGSTSTAPSTVVSRSQTEATPEIKKEDDDDNDDDESTLPVTERQMND